MGWFSTQQESSLPNLPNRESRQKCWETRDTYFACLDRVEAGGDGKACSKEKIQYEANCAKSWIEYFNQRRVIGEAQKDRLARANEQIQSSKK